MLAIIERYIDAYNAFDVGGLVQDLHEDVSFSNQSAGVTTHETRGRAAFRAQAEEAANMFSARKQTIERVTKVVEETNPSVTVDIDYSATLAKDLPNGMKAGQNLEMAGESEFRFAQGKIISIIDRS